jgi:cellulose synthase operon protein YhjQ
MKDPNPLSDQNPAPEDVATLYSWANLHGAKYRDFSAARAQTREKSRLRAEQAVEEALQPSQPEAVAQEAVAERATEEPREVEEARANEPARNDAREEMCQEASLETSLETSPGTGVEQAYQAEARQEQTQPERTGQEQTNLEQMNQEQTNQGQSNQEQTNQVRAQREQVYQAEIAAEQTAFQAGRASQLAAAQQAAEQAAKIEAEQAARRAAQESAELAALQAVQRARDHAAYLTEQEAAQRAVQRAAEQAAQHGHGSQLRTWQQQPPAGRFPATPTPDPATGPAADRAVPYNTPTAPKTEYETYVRPPAYRPAASQFSALTSGPFSGPAQFSPPGGDREREEGPEPRGQRTTAGTAPDAREPVPRPAWLTTDSRETPGPFVPKSGFPPATFGLPPVSTVMPPAPFTPPAATLALTQAQTSLPPALDDTLQGSRDRLTSRWFALRGVFEANMTIPEPLPAPAVSRPPAMAVFSLAGGVGKTSLVATLGRALSARGERVLLVDTAAFGLLPFFFGATDQRPGQLRTFIPPGGSSDAPIQMVTIDPEVLSTDQTSQESLSGEISKFSRGAGRVIIDLATASGATTRRIMRMAPLVLVPVIADMNSVVSVSSIDSFFEHNSNAAGRPALPYYVLNQFDASLPLHLDVREVLREQLGERLLPFALRRAPAMSEALAEGMTVMDYAPGSTLAEDFNTLAGWVKSLSAPATTNYRGVRWSER